MPAPMDSPAVARGGPHISCKAAKRLDLSPTPSRPAVDILDIRRATVEVSLKEEILSMFNPKTGPRKLPTLLLYDDAGLQFFENVGCLIIHATSCVLHANALRVFQITYLDEYYLTDYEIEVLQQSAANMAAKIPSGSMVIELGSGSVSQCRYRRAGPHFLTCL